MTIYDATRRSDDLNARLEGRILDGTLDLAIRIQVSLV